MNFFWVLPILSAFLLALSFERSYLGPLSLVGLIPFFIFLENPQLKTKNYKLKTFLGGWLAGSIFFALVYRWVLYPFPGDWAGVHNALTAAPLFAIIWLGTSVFVGLSFALFGFFAFKLLNFETFKPYFIIPSLWILSEYLRAWLFGLFLWGPGATLGPHWTFGNLGYALIDTPAIFWSRFGGLYSVSFLVVLVNVLIFRLIRPRAGRPWAENVAITLMATLVLFFLPKIIFTAKSEDKSFKVALVHTNIRLGFLSNRDFASLWEGWPDFAGRSRFVGRRPDIVVFPEGARLEAPLGRLNITSAVVPADAGLKEQIIYRNQKGELIDVQDKTFLIPGGEYLPAILKGFLAFSRDQSIIQRFNALRTRVPGQEAEKPVVFEETRLGTLLCSGIVSPLLYRSLADKGAEILINSASQVIFQNRPFFLSQFKTLARFQAIANARPFLQASNGGQSFFINPDGKVVAETASFDNQILSVEVSPVRKKTFYTLFGDWPLVLAALTLFTLRSRKFRL